MLLPLLTMLIALCPGAAAAATNMRVHQADLLRLKCDVLPYRTLFKHDTCYFALGPKMKTAAAPYNCDAALKGASLQATAQTAAILEEMMLQPAGYHANPFSEGKKRVLCKLETVFTCAADERSEMAGKCLKRAPKQMNFTEARAYCAERGAQLPVIDNDDESRGLAEATGLRNSSVWLDHTIVNGKWVIGGEQQISYNFWSRDAESSPAACGDSPNTAVTLSTSKSSGKCESWARWNAPKPWSDRSTVVCVREKSSPFHPEIATTTSTTTTTTTSKPNVTEPACNCPQLFGHAPVQECESYKYIFTKCQPAQITPCRVICPPGWWIYFSDGRSGQGGATTTTCEGTRWLVAYPGVRKFTAVDAFLACYDHMGH